LPVALAISIAQRLGSPQMGHFEASVNPLMIYIYKFWGSSATQIVKVVSACKLNIGLQFLFQYVSHKIRIAP
jgi:hypothetical protein